MRFKQSIVSAVPIWACAQGAGLRRGVDVRHRGYLRPNACCSIEPQPGPRPAAASNVLPMGRQPRFQATRIDASERREHYRSLDPDRISEPFVTQPDLRSSGVWKTLTDGSRMWRLRVSAPGSLTVALVFHDFNLPQDAQMFVYATTGDLVRDRPYTTASNPRGGVLATGPLPSDEAIVEIDLRS
jgi:hypothetical protein